MQVMIKGQLVPVEGGFKAQVIVDIEGADELIYECDGVFTNETAAHESMKKFAAEFRRRFELARVPTTELHYVH